MAVPDDKKADILKTLILGLPDYYNKGLNRNNAKLLDPIAERSANENVDILDVKNATAIETADSIEELIAIGRVVGILPKTGETLEHYRARLRIEHSLYTNEATLPEVLKTAANVLEIDISRVNVYEPAQGAENGTVEINFPKGTLDNIELSGPEFGQVMDRIIPASYSVWSQRDPRYYIWAGGKGSQDLGLIKARATDWSTQLIQSGSTEGIAVHPDGTVYAGRGGTTAVHFGVDFDKLWVESGGVSESFDNVTDIAASDDSVVVVGESFLNGAVVAREHDPSDGTIRWTRDTTFATFLDSVDVTPSYAYVSGESDSVTAQFDITDGSTNWSAGRGGFVRGYRDDYVFIHDNTISSGTTLKYLEDGTKDWEVVTSFDVRDMCVGREGDLYVNDNALAHRVSSVDGSTTWTSPSANIDPDSGITYRPRRGDTPDEVIATTGQNFRIINAEDGTTIDTVPNAELTEPSRLEAFPRPSGFWDEIWNFME